MPFLPDITHKEYKPLLECESMGVSLGERHWLIKDISVTARRGEIVAVVGESGSGKTTLLRALTKLFPDATIPGQAKLSVEGSILFDGVQLGKLALPQIREFRTKRIRYVFQEPGSVLNPLLTIGTQFRVAGITEHATIDALTQLQLGEPKHLLNLYPHQVSVGMLQRISMAMALHGSPSLILADEPTSAVDAILREQIMQILVDRCRNSNTAMLVATHDLNIVRQHADTIIVMLGGRIVERSSAKDFFSGPLHPYSQTLLDWSQTTSLPKDASRSNAAGTWDKSCLYESVCSRVHDDCLTAEPVLQHATPTRDVRCLYWK